MLEAIALVLVVLFSTAVCWWQYGIRQFDIDELDPLDGDPLDKGWGRFG